MSEPTKVKDLLPEDIQELKRIFEVKRERGVVYDERGERGWEDKVFIRIFAEFQESGWLARLSSSELKVLISLALRMDEERQAYPSIARIAHDTGYSERQVIRTLRKLEEKQLVSREKRRDGDKRYKNNLYTILPHWIRGVEKAS
jgi:DNA-binding transcriptional ArsR family regulator